MEKHRARRTFAVDFAALEKALLKQRRERIVVMTPEQLIVELALTPQKVARIEKKFGVRLDWHAKAYAALCRHNLMPAKPIEWEVWLGRYQRAKAR